MRLLGVRVEVVQPCHPYITDGTHVGLLTRVDSLVDPELSLIVELFITEVAAVPLHSDLMYVSLVPLAIGCPLELFFTEYIIKPN